MNRRTLAKGAAWTIPAIAIAATAPSLAASPTADLTRVTGSADKCPGNADVPGGWPKHGYRVVLSIHPEPSVVVPVSVILGNGKFATIVGDATRTDEGWEFIVDAASSPSSLAVTVLIDGTEHTVHVEAHPHCGRA